MTKAKSKQPDPRRVSLTAPQACKLQQLLRDRDDAVAQAQQVEQRVQRYVGALLEEAKCADGAGWTVEFSDDAVELVEVVNGDTDANG